MIQLLLNGLRVSRYKIDSLVYENIQLYLFMLFVMNIFFPNL